MGFCAFCVRTDVSILKAGEGNRRGGTDMSWHTLEETGSILFCRTNGFLFISLTFAWLVVIQGKNRCNDVCWNLFLSVPAAYLYNYRQWMQVCCIHCISNLLRPRVCAIEHDRTFFCEGIKCHLGVGHLQTKGHQPICRYKQSKIRKPSAAMQEIE